MLVINNDEIIVHQGVSRYGLGQLHVMRMGAKPDVEAYMARVEEECGPVTWKLQVAYEEEGLGVHHLRLYWRQRNERE